MTVCHSLDSPSFKGKVNFNYLPRMGKSSKLKKKGRGGSMVQGQVFLKGWLALLICSKFIIFIFRNFFTLCKIVLYIWRKKIFFCHHNFMRKSHSKLPKNELVCMCKECWCVELGQVRRYLCESEGTVWNTLKGCRIKKRRGETSYKKRGKLGQWVGTLKNGDWNPLTNYWLLSSWRSRCFCVCMSFTGAFLKWRGGWII